MFCIGIGHKDAEVFGGSENNLFKLVGQFANHSSSYNANTVASDAIDRNIKRSTYWFDAFFIPFQSIDMGKIRKGQLRCAIFQTALGREHIKNHVNPKDASHSVK